MVDDTGLRQLLRTSSPSLAQTKSFKRPIEMNSGNKRKYREQSLVYVKHANRPGVRQPCATEFQYIDLHQAAKSATLLIT
jgi:hypothetical protein